MTEIDVHADRFEPGSAIPVQTDALTNYVGFNVANPAGAVGAIVTVSVSLPGSPLPTSGNYFVEYDLPAAYLVFTTKKTAAGFAVNLQPLPGNTVKAGTFNVWVRW